MIRLVIRGEGRNLALGFLALAALGLFVLSRLAVTTDITHFLPGGELDVDGALAQQLASSELSRTTIVLVEAPDQAAALAASRDLEAALLGDPHVAAALAFLEAGVSEGVEQALWTLIHPRRFGFLDARPEDLPHLLSSEGLAAAAQRLKARLALPVSTLLSRTAPEDPLLILPGLVAGLAGSRAEQIRLVDGRFLTADGKGAVLFLGTHAPSFDSQVQRPFLARIHGAFDSVDLDAGGVLALRISAASRFAIQAEDAIRSDIRLVGIGSTIGLGTMILLLFRSLRLVLLALPVVAAAFLAGTACCLAVFGEIHGLTLAFGAALVGVSIDYAFHFHCHQTLAPGSGGPRQTLRGIWPGLLLCAATTIVGFLALLVSTFPGLRELALFGATGIAAALLATRLLLPGLASSRAGSCSAALAAADALARAASGVARHRRLLAVPALLLLGTAGTGLAHVRWNDDVTDLNQIDAQLAQEDGAVRARLTPYEQRRMVVALGADEQQALEVNDRVRDALAAARAAGELAAFRNLGDLLPSAERQRARDAAFRDDTDLWPRLRATLQAAGFVADAFEPFRAELLRPAPEPLRWDDLARSPAAPIVRPFRVSLEDRTAFLSFVHDVRDVEALSSRLAAVPGARLVDIGAVFTRAYGAYRQRMTLLLLLGVLAVIGLIAARHRALRPTLAACAPALLAVAGTVGLLSLMGVALNMLSLVALLMVVSMGDDYGIFLAEAHGDAAGLAATRLAVFASGVSTLLSFALLSLSEHPALRSIGLPATLGLLLCLLLAPALQVLLLSRKGDP